MKIVHTLAGTALVSPIDADLNRVKAEFARGPDTRLNYAASYRNDLAAAMMAAVSQPTIRAEVLPQEPGLGQ